jgi:hypothetical protein
MTPDEVEQYLRHRVAYAGGDFDRIFAPGAAAIVHCFSAGIPRLINNVCETALTVAARRKLAQVSPRDCSARCGKRLQPDPECADTRAPRRRGAGTRRRAGRARGAGE